MSFTWRFRAFGPFKAPCVHLAVDRQMTPPSHAGLSALRAHGPLSFGSAVGIRFAAPPS